MTHSKFVFVLLCTMFYATVTFSRTFEITSNANAGPGTLREALILAANNGDAEKDLLIFKLPVSNRIILLSSKLPAVTSNLTIDGSSQAGPGFGVSDARVKLVVAYNSTLDEAVLEITKQHDVEIYGLIINRAATYSKDHHAIICESSKNIIIGAVGKGCLFGVLGLELKQVSYAQADDLSLLPDNIKISSNIFGLLEDGETLDESSLNIGAVRNLTIGGETPAEGNVFNGPVDYLDYVATTLQTGTLIIANNKFGVNASGTRVIQIPANGSTIEIWAPNLEGFVFKDNQLCGQNSLHLAHISRPFKITGNKFGTDASGTEILGTGYIQVIIGYCEQGGIIGGPGADQNVFAGSNTTEIPVESLGSNGLIQNIGSPGVELFNNVIKCNNNPHPYDLAVSNVPMTVTEIDMLSRTDDQISGTATPNARVDLYYSISCTNCAPEKYFQSVYADGSGKWSYKGKLEPYKIIASATYKGQTSEFTVLHFDGNSNVKIKMACGGNNGSITGIILKNATTYGWYNSKGELIAKTLSLLNAEPGTYQFRAADDYCEIQTQFYEIKKMDITADLAARKVKSPTCDLWNGSITGIQSNATRVVWTDEKGNERGHTLDLMEVGAGQYTLHLYNDYCEQTYGPFDVLSTGGVNYTTEIPATISNSCEPDNSSIKLDFGSLAKPDKIDWQNESGAVLGSGELLNHLGPGIYRVYFTSAAGCKTYYKSYEIKSVVPLLINLNGLKIVNEVCGNANGSISNIAVENANSSLKYKWMNESGTEVGTSLNLVKVKAGTYRLQIIDEKGCSTTTGPLTIEGEQYAQDAPTAPDVKMVAAGEALIQVNNPQEGFYRIYKDEHGSDFLQENESGMFKVQVNSSTAYYVSFRSGNCESKRTKVTILISTGELIITNSFSPNGDGINDTWVIKGIEHYPDCRVQLFNRYGSVVFQSEGYTSPFDGRSTLGELPVGIYYYVITFKGRRAPVSGSLTLIR